MKNEKIHKISALQAETHDSDAFQGAVNSTLLSAVIALLTAAVVMFVAGGCTPYY